MSDVRDLDDLLRGLVDAQSQQADRIAELERQETPAGASYANTALANGASITLTALLGMIMVSNVTDDGVELIMLQAAGSAASAGSSGLTCNLNSDAGSTLAVFRTGGVWVVKNRYGVAKSVRVRAFG